MLERYAKCPVCKKKTLIKVPPNVLRNVKRYPFTIRIQHQTHYFYVNLDSQGMITDILRPDVVE